MGEIISIGEVVNITKNLHKQGKTVVLAGGCFDILHPGHIVFLEKAKSKGDILIILLESDKKIKKIKGINRPIYNQKARAKILSALKVVDYVCLLPFMQSEISYDTLIQQIQPNVIAVTAGYVNIGHHKRVARLTGAKLKYVTKMIGNFSTSRILKLR